jgi:hypothetical protein
MKDITAETLRALLAYDPETGEFRWRVSRGGVEAGAVAGCVDREGYTCIKINGTSFKSHRLAWLHTHGAWPEHQIDHIDENKSNNRISNLRDVPQSMNQHNAIKPRKDGTSGYRGVSWERGNKRWRAQIQANGRKQCIGYFKSAEEAHAAYLAAKLRLHPGDVRNLTEIPSLPIPTTLFGRTA